MLFKNLFKGLSVALLSSFALANDCDELKSYFKGRKITFENAVRECVVNSKGDVTQLTVSNYYINESDLKKIFSYTSITSLTYMKFEPNNDETPEVLVYPRAIASLPNLKELTLDFNGFREYSRDTIDAGVLKNKNLRKLTLNSMELNQSQIDEIATLTNLEELRIKNSIYSEKLNLNGLKSLTKLTVFQTTGTYVGTLEEVPKFVFSLTNLKKLVISNHSITTIPEQLSNLKKLEHLDLSRNAINSNLPESLNNLTSLKYIDLSKNKNVKGKTLTNSSLEKCYYSNDYSLCKAKSLSCFEKSVTLKACDSSSTSTSNGKCGGSNGKCPSGQCCSKYGYCGTTSAYCAVSKGCQSEFGKCTDDTASSNGKCSGSNGKCPSGQCCSKYGYCGTTSAYCGVSKGCQSEFGKCVVDTTSTNGKCGEKYGKCPSGQCCSKYGWCGTGDKYCGTGCQSEFGKCN